MDSLDDSQTIANVAELEDPYFMAGGHHRVIIN